MNKIVSKSNIQTTLNTIKTYLNYLSLNKDDALELLSETTILNPIANNENTLYTDTIGNIYVM